MKPSIGRIVHYVVTKADAEMWNSIRNPATSNIFGEGDHLSAVVVKTWSDETVNLQVWPDGDGGFWKTSITQGTVPGTWHWPEREE